MQHLKSNLFVALWLGLAVSLSGCPEKGPEAETAATKPAEKPAKKPVKAEAPKCTDCGVITAITEIRQKGEGSGAGAVMGAVIGGLVGHQFGSGRGNDAATAAGAIGGAAAGHEIEKRAKSTISYDISVRLDNGSTRVINQSAPGGLMVGDKVRVTGNAVIRQG